MRSIDADILAQFEAKELRPFMLLNMNIDSTYYRRTDCDVPIIFNGNRYEPLGFRISPIRYSATNIVDQVQIDVDNLDQVMTAAFVGGTPQGEDVILEIVVLDSDYNLIPDASTSVTVFEGEIDSWSLDEEKLSVIVTGELAKWAQRTLAIHSASCRWKVFKGTNLVVNGTFDSDTIWSKGIGWDIGVTHAGKAHCDGSQVAASYLSQDLSLIIGKTYRVVYTLSNYSAGSIVVYVGSSSHGTSRTADGTYTEDIICAGNSSLYFQADANFVGSIDNVVVYDIAVNQCLYAGAETWCDRTYARCTVLGNTDNFGGFRWLPSIIDKEVWWGRLRGEDET